MPGMAFTVSNTVRADKDKLHAIVDEVASLSAGLIDQPGFRSARVYLAEDESEARMLIEWDSREDFLAYRQSELGRSLVSWAMEHHPQIAFYQVVAAIDAPKR